MAWLRPTTLMSAAAVLATGLPALAETPVRSDDEIRAIVAEMLADAEGRTSLLQSGGTAGHDGKFFLASNDGQFRLNVGGQIQFRYIVNWTDDDNTVTDDDFQNGFQTRRTKLDFNGTVHDRWNFKIVGAFDRNGGDFTLEDAWLEYAFNNNWKMRFGQFKLPLLREELVSSKYQLAVERSVVNEIFTQDRSQGIQLAYRGDNFAFTGAFSDGLDSENTDFGSRGGTGFITRGEGDYAFTGRLDWKFAGDWKQFDDFTSRQGDDFAGLFGAAIHWQESANTNDPTDVDLQTLQYTADLSLEGNGWGAFVAWVGRNHFQSGPIGAGDTDFFDWGVVAQGSFRFTETFELFARYDGLWVDEDRLGGGADDQFNFATVGVNWYFQGHAAKASLDVVYSINETDDLVTLGGLPQSGAGILGSSDDGEVAIRAQFQLLF